MSVLPVAGCEFPAIFLGKVAFDAVGLGVGLGVGLPWFRVDSEEALLKLTDVRAPLAHSAPGVTKSRMVGRQETMNDMEMRKYVPQMTASFWMPFKQTCPVTWTLTCSKRRPGTPVGHKGTNYMR